MRGYGCGGLQDDNPSTKSGMQCANRNVNGSLHWVICGQCLFYAKYYITSSSSAFVTSL